MLFPMGKKIVRKINCQHEISRDNNKIKSLRDITKEIEGR